MIRTMPPLLAALLLAGCDRPAPAPRTPGAVDQGFDHAAASRSIMQPKVIAESPPEPVPTPTPTPPPREATVLFAGGSALDDTARAAIDALLSAPGRPADARWVLRGSSDTEGSNAANLAVSRKRALAVRAYLIGKGIDADRIATVALGDGRPVAPNVTLDGRDDPAGRARNRRVDILIEPPEAPAATPVAPAVPATG